MATSTLDLDNTPEPDNQLGKGHGNKSLGPSGSSDSGSDIQAGLWPIDEPELGLGLDRGTSEDSDTHSIEASDGNEDSTGTGEASTAGREADVELNADIDFDRIDQINPEEEENLDASAEELPRPRRPEAGPSPRKRD